MSATIRTARLVLEPASAEMVLAVLDGVGPVAAHGWPGPEALQTFQFAAEHGADPGWLILLGTSAGAVVVGQCGTHGPPDAAGTVEISYGIAPPERGQGLATEACAALSAWLLAQPGVDRVTARTHAAGNPASRRVLERCGFVLDGVDDANVRYVLTRRQGAG